MERRAGAEVDLDSWLCRRTYSYFEKRETFFTGFQVKRVKEPADLFGNKTLLQFIKKNGRGDAIKGTDEILFMHAPPHQKILLSQFSPRTCFSDTYAF